MLRQDKTVPCVLLSELQAYVRLETGDEEALAAGLLRTCTELCEQFVGFALLARAFTEEIEASDDGRPLSIAPVRSISSVHVTGSAVPLAPQDYHLAINRDGLAVISCARSAGRLKVSGVAGLAQERNDIPEPLRQGIVRLAASFFSNRDGLSDDIPASVTALWRPYRRLGATR